MKINVAVDNSFTVELKWLVTFCIAEGLEFEKRPPGGNVVKKYDDEIMKKFLARVQPPTKAKL